MRTRGHEERVHEIVVAVQRGVARFEFNSQAIEASVEFRRRKNQLAVRDVRWQDGPVDLRGPERAGPLGLEVQRQRRAVVAEGERDDDAARDGLGSA